LLQIIARPIFGFAVMVDARASSSIGGHTSPAAEINTYRFMVAYS